VSAGDQLTLALECADRGWFVFPCQGPEHGDKFKAPWTKNGHLDATLDRDQITRWWTAKPKAYVGIDTGRSGLVVADVDTGGAVDGYDTWHDLTRTAPEIEDTALVETQSGGQHAYYRANGHKVQCDNEGKRLGPGIHVKAQGGYVIAGGNPGYEYVDGHGPERVAKLPAVLAEKVAYRRTQQPVIPEAVLGVPEGSRNGTLTSRAGRMRDIGMEGDEMAAALLVANKARCKPPLSEAEVRTIARSVSRYEPGPAAEAAAACEVVSPFIDWATFWDVNHAQSEWLFLDVLAKGRGHALYAKHGQGKSLFLLWLTAQLATGAEPVTCLYLDYEMTAADVQERLEDMGFGPGSDLSRLRYLLHPDLPPLDTAKGATALFTVLDRVMKEQPDHHVFVAFDTISRAVCGEENDADTYRAFSRLTGIGLKRRGVTWARNDHAGKDAKQEQRGSSSKGDDVDVVWLLEQTAGGIMLKVKKRRMAWVPEKVAFNMLEDPLRYEPVQESWPPGTVELADYLDQLGVPLEASRSAANKAIKAAATDGKGRRTELVTAALKWRVRCAVEKL